MYDNSLLIAADQKFVEKKYWLNQFSDLPARISFPYDFFRRIGQSHWEVITLELERELIEQLDKLSGGSPHAIHTILFTGVMALLYRYSGETDITLGMPIYKQKETSKLINKILAIRSCFNPKITFKELLFQVKKTVIDAIKHQNYPVIAIPKVLDFPADVQGFPLFDIAIVLNNIQDELDIRNLKPNLLFSFHKIENKLNLSLIYNSSLYKEETIRQIALHWQLFTNNSIATPDNSIADIRFMTEKEINHVLFELNDTSVDFPTDKTIHQLFEEQVAKNPENTALVYKGESLSYLQLNKKANGLAMLLRNKGVGPDTIVGLLLESSLERIIAILGILKAGGAYLPIDNEFPESRIFTILKECHISILLTKIDTVDGFSLTLLKKLHISGVLPCMTSKRDPIKDFDALPWPDRNLIDYSKYSNFIGHAMVKHTVSIQTTRGCPYKCAYCHKIWPKTHTFRSADCIFAEVQSLYKQGARRFAFVDDIFNLNIKNSRRFFQLIVDHDLDVQFFFPNGLRGDILTEDFIDLMVKAGTVNIAFALETASPRLQKLIGKNLDLDKFSYNIQYIADKYPHVVLELFTMLGFPSETEEEAMMTFEFMTSLKWIHFPYVFILKVFPNTDMAKLAIEKGVPVESIMRSANLAYHELPETLPFSKSFVLKYQTLFTTEYFLSKERLLHVLPQQIKIATEDELVQKYDNYLPMDIKKFSDILQCAGIAPWELGPIELLQDPTKGKVIPYRENSQPPTMDLSNHPNRPFRILLLDMSQLFSHHKENQLHHQMVEPLGLMYLMTYLKEQFGDRVQGRVFKSRIDFDNFDELKVHIDNTKPDLIGIRTLSFYKEFFHETVLQLRLYGIKVPIISGGPYATSDYKLILQDSQVDLVILGEGEHTLAQLVGEMLSNDKKLPPENILKTIPGIAFIRDIDKPLLKQNTTQLIFIDQLNLDKEENQIINPPHINKPSDLLYVISTSGSSGKPKNVMIEHRNLANLLHCQSDNSRLDFSGRVMQFASIGFDVSAQEIFSTLTSGGELYLIDNETKLDVPLLLDIIKHNNIDTLFLPPAFLKFVFSDPDYSAQFPINVKHIITAGEQLVITPQIRKYAIDNGVTIHNHYGPTETHVVTTLTLLPTETIPEIPTIGKPIANTRIYILDENKNPMPLYTAGELYIAGHNVGRGYYKADELTWEKYSEDPFTFKGRMYRTGDLARWDRQGNIEFIGRVDFQVKIRGFRIELGEIENHLMEIPAIKEVAVIDKEDDKGDKYLVAYIIGTQILDSTKLRNELSNHLPDYMMPSYFIQLEKFPLTSNGKLDRRLLPDPKMRYEEDYIAPRDDVEKKLLKIWSEILGVEKDKIGIDTNFFDLGGHSLKATMMISKIHKILKVKLPFIGIFDSPHIRGLAKTVKSLSKKTFNAIEPTPKKEYYPLSSAQKRLFILQQMDLGITNYNMPTFLLIEESLESTRIESTFKALIERHESLRTSLHIINKEPVQKINEVVEFELQYIQLDEMGDIAKEKEIVRQFIRPFNLAQAPLLRVGLLKRNDTTFILMVDMHHIISDGISGNILVKDFSALYTGSVLPPLKLHYKDYSQWQNDPIHNENIKLQEEYWLDEFSGEIPILNLPADYPRPPIMSFAGESLGFEIGEFETASLRQLAHEEGGTLFIVLLAIYSILLAKLSRQNDIVIGSPVVGRRHADLEKIIGMFVNTLAFRNFPNPDEFVNIFLNYVKLRVLAALENQEFQFEDLVEKVVLTKDLSRNPIFNVMFVLNTSGQDSIPDESENHKKLEMNIKNYPYISSTSKFDLNFMGLETKDNVHFRLEYSTALFEKETIYRFIGYLKNIINAIIQDRYQKISSIEILSPKERETLVYKFNRTDSDFSSNKTMHLLFEEQVEKTPQNIALSIDGNTLMYSELNRKANQLAYELQKNGIRANSLVALVINRSIEMVISVMAVLKAGGAFVPMETYLPEGRITKLLESLNITCIITNPLQLNKVMQISGKLIQLTTVFCLSDNVSDHRMSMQSEFAGKKLIFNTDITSNPDANPAPLAQATDMAYVIFTSGSTGIPKGVIEQHRPVINIIEWVNRMFNVSPHDKLLFIASIGFDLSIYDIFGLLAAGGTLRIVSESDIKSPNRLLDIILREDITFWDSAPAALQQLLVLLKESSINGVPLNNNKMRLIFLSGDWIPVTMPDILKKAFKKVNVISLGGATEATIWSNFYPVGKVDPNWRSIPYGKPTQNVKYYILDSVLHACPIGVPGDLYIGGQCLAAGYVNDPHITASKFIPDPFISQSVMYKTGDMARWFHDGNIEFLGRMDHQVKIRGFRIELGEIQSQLLNHPMISDVVVIARGETRGDKFLCAYYIIAQESGDKQETLTHQQLRDYLAKELPDYMIPTYFLELENIPVTANGKLDRKALPEPQPQESGKRFIKPRDVVEETLAYIWSDVLAIPQKDIGIDSDFFALGGHSLKGTILTALIHKLLNVEVPLTTVFSGPTIRELGVYIKQARKVRYSQIRPIEKQSYYPQSSAQKRLFFLEQFENIETSYNIPSLYKVIGELDKKRMKETFQQLIRRHETLRTCFKLIDNEPIQVVHDAVNFQLEEIFVEISGDSQEEVLVKKAVESFIRPFDLGNAPLLRVALLTLSESRHLVLTDIHHIVSDGTSQEILIEEFVCLYNGGVLSQLNIQYKDFSAWQNDLFESGKIRQQQEYWEKVYVDGVPSLNMPTDFPRPGILNYKGDSIFFTIDAEKTKILKSITEEYGTTLYMELLAIFNILLAKYTGQNDIVIGSGILGRPHSDLQRIIGLFVNLLAIRNRPSQEKTFIDFLKEVKVNALAAYDNQDVQFEMLVDKLKIQREPSHHPLFDVLFVFQNFQQARLDRKHDKVHFESYKFGHEITYLDISLLGHEIGDEIMIRVVYSTSLFVRSSMEKFTKRFQEILDQVVENKDIPIKDIKISHDVAVLKKKISGSQQVEFGF